MHSLTKLGIGAVLLAGFVLAPAYGAMARDWGSHENHANRPDRADRADHADRPHNDRAASPRSFQGGSPPASHNMPSRNMSPRDFRGTPPGFHGNARDFGRNRSEARDFRSRDRGFESRNFSRESRNVSRDFRNRSPRDFSDRSRPARDFQRPSRDFHGTPRDFRGGSSRNSHVTASHQFRGFHGRDYAHFTAQDHQRWRQGNWHHGHHNGHFGWWWICDGFWFFYNAPIYPYPTYVSYYYDDAYYGDQSDYYWYWCDDPQGYYPYVQECYGPWRPVSPTPDAYGPDGYGSGDYGSGDYGPGDDGPDDYGPDQ